METVQNLAIVVQVETGRAQQAIRLVVTEEMDLPRVNNS